MKDWRRVRDWGGAEQKGGGEVGWGQQQQHCVAAARSSNSKSGKPPPAPGSWQPTIPSWEKRFCTNVCRVPWKKICETKRLMSYYSNVLDWDDSAGKEAFNNAKARFFAKINGLACDISLPGPDIYIDEINWDVEIDPQLFLDLEKEFLPADVETKDGKLGFLSSGWDRVVPCTGWGDAEDVSSPVGDAWTESGRANSGGNEANAEGWDRFNEQEGGAKDSSGWDNGDWNNNFGWEGAPWYDNSGWGGAPWYGNFGWGEGTWNENSGREVGGLENTHGQKTTGWEDNTGWANECREKNFQCQGETWGTSLDTMRPSDSWQQHQLSYWESKKVARKRDGDAPYSSRPPAFRHQRWCNDSYQPNKRNSKGWKRANYQREQPILHDRLVPQQWNVIRSSVPKNIHGSAATAGGG